MEDMIKILDTLIHSSCRHVVISLIPLIANSGSDVMSTDSLAASVRHMVRSYKIPWYTSGTYHLGTYHSGFLV